MDIARDVFSKKRVDFDRLDAAGFVRDKEGVWTYTEEFMDGDLTAAVTIGRDNCVICSAFDTASGEEYLPMNIEAYTGS